MTDEIQHIAAEIFAGHTPVSDPRLLAATTAQLTQALAMGYTKNLDTIAWDTPDAPMITNLTRNIYHFSAAKNYHQLQDMTLALHDGQNLLSQSDYLARIHDLNIKYNRTWLATERHTAIAGAQMAGRWTQFQSQKAEIPLLTYHTIGDANVRQSHAALHGTSLPVDHPFWHTHYPPNGYLCRCDVQQSPGATPTPAHQVPNIPIPQMFRTNLARAGLIFPAAHPYYTGVPQAVLRDAITYLPPQNTYITIRSTSGAPIQIHPMHNTAEVAANTHIANDLINAGYKNIRLLPDIHAKAAPQRAKYLPKGYQQADPRKNPDAWFTDAAGHDHIADFKTITSHRNLANRIAEAARQADYAVIKLHLTDIRVQSIQDTINRKMAEIKTLKGVIIIDQDGQIIINKTR